MLLDDGDLLDADDDLDADEDLIGEDEDLHIEEYDEGTQTLSAEELEATDPNIKVQFDDIEEEDPDDVGYDDIEEDDGEFEDEEEFEDDDEYEIEQSGLKAQISGLISKLKDLPNKFKKKKAVDSESDDEDEEDDELGEKTSVGTQSKIIELKDKLDQTMKTVVDQKIPMLKKLLNKNKDGDVKATDLEGNELEELELDGEVTQEEGGRKKIAFKVKHVLWAAVLGVAAWIILEEDPATNPQSPPVQDRAEVRPRRKLPPPPPPPPKEEVVQKPVDPLPPPPPPPVEEVKEDKVEEKTVEEKPFEEKTVEEKLEKVEENAKVNLDDIKADNIEYAGKEGNGKETSEENKVDDKKEQQDEDSVAKTEPNKAADELADLDPVVPDSPSEPEKNTVETAPLEEIDEVVDVGSKEGQNSDEADQGDIDSEPKVTEAKEEEIIPQKELQPDISSEITKKLLEDLEVKLKEEKVIQKKITVTKPTDAPSYEIVGRGLVYNCRDKHWACIEQDQYKTCRENYSWNQTENIPLECYPVAFLETEYDCAVVQQEKIDSVSSTDFCLGE